MQTAAIIVNVGRKGRFFTPPQNTRPTMPDSRMLPPIRLTLWTELYLARRTPSSGGLANSGGVGAALWGRGGKGVEQAVMLFSFCVVSDMLF